MTRLYPEDITPTKTMIVLDDTVRHTQDTFVNIPDDVSFESVLSSCVCRLLVADPDSCRFKVVAVSLGPVSLSTRKFRS